MIVDTKAKRDRSRTGRRNRLLLIGVLPALVLIVFAGRVGLMLASNSSGQDAYSSGQYADAGREFEQNTQLNPFERWVARFNEGDARARAEDYAGAATAFEQALRVVPKRHECEVRENLALVREAQGDQAVKSQDLSGALTGYHAALKALGAHCNRQLEEELQQRLQIVQQSKPSSTPSPKPGHDPKQDQLQESNQQGEQTQQDTQQSDDYPSTGNDYQW